MHNVFPNDVNEVVSIRTALHMIEAEGVKQLVNHGAMAEAPAPDRVAARQVKDLVPSLITHLGEAASSTSLEIADKKFTLENAKIKIQIANRSSGACSHARFTRIIGCLRHVFIELLL